MNQQAKILIIGMGVTGHSCARYLQSQGARFSLADNHMDKAQAKKLAQQYQTTCLYGELDEQQIAPFDTLVLSPGVVFNQPLYQCAIKAGKTITSDIELFVQACSAKLIGITGSNGKTTVTTWLYDVFNKLGLKVAMGGNIGTPVLDLLNDKYDVVVLELSSFQLDLYRNIPLDIAVILNISQDHLDRYDSFVDYQQSKLSICNHAKQCLVDSQTSQRLQQAHHTFGIDTGDFMLQQAAKQWHLSAKMFNFSFDNCVLFSQVERLNALVVLSVATLFNIKPVSVEPLLKELNGLKHRNQFVATINGVNYVNDSKGTNVGATQVAVKAQNSPVILIAGGQAKNADFSELKATVHKYCKALVLIGQDAKAMSEALSFTPSYYSKSLHGALRTAKSLAQKGDTVLLSPACASFDMFNGYQDRGEQFIAQVEKMQVGIAC